MPTVKGKKYAYTAKGVKAAKKAMKKAVKKTMKKSRVKSGSKMY